MCAARYAVYEAVYECSGYVGADVTYVYATGAAGGLVKCESGEAVCVNYEVISVAGYTYEDSCVSVGSCASAGYGAACSATVDAGEASVYGCGNVNSV